MRRMARLLHPGVPEDEETPWATSLTGRWQRVGIPAKFPVVYVFEMGKSIWRVYS